MRGKIVRGQDEIGKLNNFPQALYCDFFQILIVCVKQLNIIVFFCEQLQRRVQLCGRTNLRQLSR